jgi:hypothetical protein
MSKPWLGYVAAALFVVAGLFQIVAKNYILGVLFVVLAIANVMITIYINKNKNNKNAD